MTMYKMKIKKLFLIFPIALALVACDKNDTPLLPQDTDTYVGVNLAFPGKKSGARVLPGDYNSNGEWKGRDAIKKITVYVVNEQKGTVNYTDFGIGQFEGIDNNGFLKPTLAVAAIAGHQIKVYAVVNDVNDKTASLKTIGSGSFDAQFKNLTVTAVAADVATYDNGEQKETVMMTNFDAIPQITVAAGVSQAQAINGTNRADVNVSRVVSRAIVTMKTGVGAGTKIAVKEANGTPAGEVTLKEVKYAVGQSNRKFFNMNKSNWSTPDPVYGYVPSNDWATNNFAYFDYADLQSHQEIQAVADIQNATIQGALNAETFSKFVLPITHEDDKYKKGNTTYFEIRCTFVPDEIDGAATAPATAPATVFLGMQNGKFYSSRALAQTAVPGQKVTQYKNGVMKYVLWLNPNHPYGGAQKITMSPTVRNQVYHAHISGFNEIGLPGNPLNPGTPGAPGDPDDPNDPENPENPIKTDDPLQTEKSYMSVSITVLPWTVHSYEVNMGNYY